MIKKKLWSQDFEKSKFFLAVVVTILMWVKEDGCCKVLQNNKKLKLEKKWYGGIYIVGHLGASSSTPAEMDLDNPLEQQKQMAQSLWKNIVRACNSSMNTVFGESG